MVTYHPEFLVNKYTCWYYQIVSNASLLNRRKLKKTDVNYIYYESHHVLPSAMGGSDDAFNRVLLTCREHFICHWLLTKMTTGRAKMSSWNALGFFTSRKKLLSSRQYQIARLAKSNIEPHNKGKVSADKGKKFYNDGIQQRVFFPDQQPEGWVLGRTNRTWNTGLTKDDPRIKQGLSKMSAKLKGRPVWNKGKTNCYSQETRDKISKTLTGTVGPNKGKKFSEEWCKNLGEARKGKPTWNKGLHNPYRGKLKIDAVSS